MAIDPDQHVIAIIQRDFPKLHTSMAREQWIESLVNHTDVEREIAEDIFQDLKQNDTTTRSFKARSIHNLQQNGFMIQPAQDQQTAIKPDQEQAQPSETDQVTTDSHVPDTVANYIAALIKDGNLDQAMGALATIKMIYDD